MSWRTVSLGELVDNFSVRAKDHIAETSSLEFCGVSNEDGIVKSKYAAEEKAEDYKIIEKDCFAYNPYRINVGSIGLLEEDIVGLISPAYVVFKPKPRSIIPQLLLKFLKSSEGLRQIKLYARGTVRQALRFDDLCKIELAVPDYDEQLELFKKIEETEIETSVLSTELTHQLDLVKQLRQAFLREAMQGKLVPQHPNDPPATELLQQIKAEKAQLIKEGKVKKQKPLPPIAPDEIPFEIPDNWVWCRLGEMIYDTEGGKSPNCQNLPAESDQWGVIKTTAVQEMIFLENENKILPEKFVVNPKHVVENGDVLITRAGPKNRVGIVCCVENLSLNLILSDKTIRILHNKTFVNSKFMALALNSPLIKPIIESKMTGMADSQVNISQDNMKKFSIPLPPLPEQQRIVAKLDELMQLCDGLEASIRQSQAQNTQLLQQVLREALEPA
jgi:type I restriction enzyme S subunit